MDLEYIHKAAVEGASEAVRVTKFDPFTRQDSLGGDDGHRLTQSGAFE